jgi:hypothetical protein
MSRDWMLTLLAMPPSFLAAMLVALALVRGRVLLERVNHVAVARITTRSAEDVLEH